MVYLKIKKSILCFGTVGTLLFSTQLVKAQSVNGGFEVNAMSKYIWRGMEIHNKVAVQTDLNLGYRGFTVDFWSDYRTGDNSEVDEVDFTLDYTKSVSLKRGKLSVSTGYIYYDIDGGDTQEIYVGAGYSDKIFSLPISLGATIYRDIDAIQSTYLELTGSTEFPLNTITISPYITLGYYWYDHGEDDWNNLELGIDTSVPINKSFYLHGLVAYSIGNDDLGVDNEFYGGVGVGFNF
jgi:hypothetical protein